MGAAGSQRLMGWASAAAWGLSAVILAARFLSDSAEEGVRGLVAIGAPVIAAAAAYAVSHVLRILRLAVLLDGRFEGLRRLSVAHLAGAMISGLTPWRCGELLRVLALAGSGAGLARAAKAAIIERALDAAGLAAACALLAWAEPAWAGLLIPVATAAAILLVLVAALLRAAPENTRLALCYVIRRYTSRRALRVATALATIEGFLRDAPRMVFGRAGATASLTAAIWASDLFAAGIVVRSMGGTWLLGAFGAVSELLRMPGSGFAAAAEAVQALPPRAMLAIDAWNGTGTPLAIGVAACAAALLAHGGRK